MTDKKSIMRLGISAFFSAALLLTSCSNDDDAIDTNSGTEEVTIAGLNLVWNKYKLEDRTDKDGAVNPSGVDNGYAKMLMNDDATKFYLGLTNFDNIDKVIDVQHPNVTASKFAVFLTTAGAGLGAQNDFNEGDRPIYIGELTMNGENVIALKPHSTGGDLTIGGQSIKTRLTSSVTLTKEGFVTKQKSLNSDKWYDWVVLHPFEGENLRPITYPGIVADLDATNDLDQNIKIADLNKVWNKFKLEDRTDGKADENPTGIDNGYAKMLMNDDASRFYFGFTGFNNVGKAIDLMNPNIEASRFAVFLTTAGAGLGAQNGFDEGDRPIYIGTLTKNGEGVMSLKPHATGGKLTIGGQEIYTRPTSGVTVTADGFVNVKTKSTGSKNTYYDWVVLHPYQGDNLRPISYPGIVADLDAAGDLDQNK